MSMNNWNGLQLGYIYEHLPVLSGDFGVSASEESAHQIQVICRYFESDVQIAAQKATAAYIRIYDQELKDIENTIKYMEVDYILGISIYPNSLREGKQHRYSEKVEKKDAIDK